MMEFYLDTADMTQLARFRSCLPLKGVTTNPSILAVAGIGVKDMLFEVSQILGKEARFHVQLVASDPGVMLKEAEQLAALPYDIVIKIPATETGLSVIKKVKQQNIPVLATAIYSVQQGMMAALNGADYLAPYVNRMDTMGIDGLAVVAQLQQFVERYRLPCCVLPASFKNTRQITEVLALGVGAITVSPEMAALLVNHGAADWAVKQFNSDWHQAFGDALSYQT